MLFGLRLLPEMVEQKSLGVPPCLVFQSTLQNDNSVANQLPPLGVLIRLVIEHSQRPYVGVYVVEHTPTPIDSPVEALM